MLQNINYFLNLIIGQLGNISITAPYEAQQ